jgi:Holliday junction resolvasome RuvABC endonuclease subunit
MLFPKSTTLSIDIGKHNLGYAIWDAVDNALMYGIFDLDEHSNGKNLVVGRCTLIIQFISDIYDLYQFEKLIIERQVSTNIIAMELMYTITTAALLYTKDIIIFDPKLKFTSIHEKYITTNKAHKRQSVMYANNVLHIYNGDPMTDFDKKDDIADAINQLFVSTIDDKTYLRSVMVDCRIV